MSLRVNCFGKTHPLSLVVSFFLTVCNFCLVWEGRVVVAAIVFKTGGGGGQGVSASGLDGVRDPLASASREPPLQACSHHIRLGKTQ